MGATDRLRTGAAAHPDPSASYRWLEPPAGAEIREPPLARRVEVPADIDSVPAVEVWTGDLQAVVSLPEVRLPERPDRDGISIAITPRRPDSVGELPGGWFADGNAYEVIVTDGGFPLAAIEPPGELLLAVPHETATVLHAGPDRASWERVDAHVVGAQVVTELARSGTYLAVTDHPIVVSASDGSDASVAPIIVILGSVLLLTTLLLLRRLFERTEARAAAAEAE